jgi:hypothetical protein
MLLTEKRFFCTKYKIPHPQFYTQFTKNVFLGTGFLCKGVAAGSGHKGGWKRVRAVRRSKAKKKGNPGAPPANNIPL